MGEFRMPSLGADMDRGTVVEWRVHPGDRVHRGDIVAVVDTDKSDIDVEIFEDGIIDELLVEPGRTVAVGTVLARLRPGDAGPANAPELARREAAHPPEAARQPEPSRPAEPGPPTEPSPPAEPSRPAALIPATRPARSRAARTALILASPYARSLAAVRGVDLASLAGSGPGGAVLAADLDAAPTKRTDARDVPKAQRRQAAARRATAALMAKSKREIPHYYLATTVELDAALTWMREHNAARTPDQRVLPAALILRSIALTAREHATMNGFWVDGDLQPSAAVHLGLAVSLRGGGLIVATIRDADQLGVDDLMRTIADTTSRARAGTLRSSEMSAPTITVTNLGDQGVEEVFGVIYPPQVALVGCGRIVERPWASGGLLGVKPVMRLTLSADHRASDGHRGARFLASIDHLLQKPEALS